jgi:hypothetical protein
LKNERKSLIEEKTGEGKAFCGFLLEGAKEIIKLE